MRRAHDEMDSSSSINKRLDLSPRSPSPLGEPENRSRLATIGQVDLPSPSSPVPSPSLQSSSSFSLSSSSSSLKNQGSQGSSTESLSDNSSKLSIDETVPGVLHSNIDSALFPPSLFPVLAECSFGWNIECWDGLPQKVVGHKFNVGSLSLSLMMQSQEDVLSLYLMLHPCERNVCVDLIFEAKSLDDAEYHRRGTSHRFTSYDFSEPGVIPDWGFRSFLALSLFKEKIIRNNTVFIGVHVRLLKDSPSFGYSSHMIQWNSSTVDPSLPRSACESRSEDAIVDERARVGYLGLHNQGATCYMNSILQSLFLTNAFRRSILQIPTRGHDAHNSVSLALQRLFWQLQFGREPPNTNELTDSFGWDTMQAFTQHDVQEFLIALLDNLEAKMKNTSAEGAIERLFVAKVGQIVQCLHVSFESVRQDTLYDIQLPIDGCKSLQESLKRFTAPEYLVGNNKYNAEGHGLQDAKMFTMFTRLPPVLHLILMRYRYDPVRDMTVKINDRFEFPPEIDMRPYVKDPAACEDYVYALHSVLVHSGDLHGGHYCAFVKDFDAGNEEDQWLKFDDTLVYKVGSSEAIDENFGEDAPTAHSPDASIDLADLGQSSFRVRRNRKNFKRITNAYMLVYVKKNEVGHILSRVGEEDYDVSIGPAIQAELEAERQKLRLEHEGKLSMEFRWAPWSCVGAYRGMGVVGNVEEGTGSLVSSLIRVRHNDSKVKSLKQQLSQVSGEDAGDMEVLACGLRKNSVIRVSKLFYPDEQYVHKFVDDPPAEFFIAAPRSKAFAVFEEPVSRSSVLLMWKLFDGASLHNLVFTCCSEKATIGSLASAVLKHCQLDRQFFLEDMQIAEELTPRKHIPHELAKSLSGAKLRTGDILTIYPSDGLDALRRLFESLYSEPKVCLRSIKGGGEDVCIGIRRTDMPQDMYREAGKALGLKDGTFKLITASPTTTEPQPKYPLLPGGIESFLESDNSVRYHPHILYYEPTDTPTESIIQIIPEGRKEIVEHEKIVGRSIAELAAGMLPNAHGESMRLWVVEGNVVRRALRGDERVPAAPGRYVLACISTPPSQGSRLLMHRANNVFGYCWIEPGTTGDQLMKQLECDYMHAYAEGNNVSTPVCADSDVYVLLEQAPFFECFSHTHASKPTSAYPPSIKLHK